MRKACSQTKIVATLGPASSSKEVLTSLIQEGVDVFRLNFSHSKQEEHLKSIQLIKELNRELNTHVAILADLQGPKLRVGEIENNRIDLLEGDIITFVTEKCVGTKEQIYMSYQEFPHDVNVGESILIDDGKIKLEVTETNKKDRVKARVIYGGPLSSKKGVNLPNTKVSLPCLTDEDISNASFALDNEVDWIALSFVRKASDILDLKELIRRKNGHAGVIAKIEKPEALDEIDQIIEVTDGVMVARGDLGVEVSFDRVPLIQKLIVEKCIAQAKPVIIATQMMESMITNFTPTRAEANDVANAVLDSADALMLSGETSVGKYPVQTIQNMQKIIDYTEKNGNLFNKLHVPAQNSPKFLADSVCYNATVIANQIKAKAIVAFTNSGYTAH
ncbi:MAG TPA: pyruvate kinase, partial [Draconibacterium sp.]|nr:pyruvate kinase [Draconibacterium sp.]